jgi:hypothetical protein
MKLWRKARGAYELYPEKVYAGKGFGGQRKNAESLFKKVQCKIWFLYG